MDPDQVEPTVIRQDRQRLLETLDLFHPATVQYRTLRLSLPTIEERNLQRDLWYFMNTSPPCLICVNERAGIPWDKREFHLTTHGCNVVKRLVDDPGTGV